MPPPPSPVTSPLRAHVSEEAQDRPGIYRFTGPKGEVLYVGKSVRVRSRLLSYFRPRLPTKQRELVRVANGVEWEYVPNHFEAIVREFRHIKAFQPRFNRQHRMRRRFAWLRLTNEAAPRLVASRAPAPDALERFGPFPAGRGLPETIRMLVSTVGLRDCPASTPMHFSDQAELFGGLDAPRCPRGDLGTCPAPCSARCSWREYRGRVDRVARFLDGQDDSPLEVIRARMTRASEAQEFELAARLRDREERLRQLRDRVVAFRDLLQGLSFLYRVPPEHAEVETADRGYVILGGRVVHSFTFGAGDEWKRPVRAALEASGGPGVGDDERTREESFLVARWFMHRPEERTRTLPFAAALKGAME